MRFACGLAGLIISVAQASAGAKCDVGTANCGATPAGTLLTRDKLIDSYGAANARDAGAREGGAQDTVAQDAVARLPGITPFPKRKRDITSCVKEPCRGRVARVQRQDR